MRSLLSGSVHGVLRLGALQTMLGSLAIVGESVNDYLAALDHSRKGEIEELRGIIMLACPELVEHIKWNAPSYQIDGDDRITMRLQPRESVDLVFHRGARKRTDAFDFADPTDLMVWKAPDRAVVSFAPGSLPGLAPQIRELVIEWIKATR